MPDPDPLPPDPAAPPPRDPPDNSFFSSATALSRTPLGFLALCLVLVYAIAALVFAVRQNLNVELSLPLVWFIVVYPVLVLVVFALLVMFFRGNLLSSEEYIQLQKMFQENRALGLANRKRLDVIAEVAPVAFDWQPTDKIAALEPVPAAAPADPQRGKWGGSRTADGYEVRAGKITPLTTDPNYFLIPLEVRRTDGAPLTGNVKFHLHPTFVPAMQEVEAENGVAKLDLVSYGAFTAGVELPDGKKLEINLADPDVDAPPEFKAR
jgi:hypothetical protein